MHITGLGEEVEFSTPRGTASRQRCPGEPGDSAKAASSPLLAASHGAACKIWRAGSFLQPTSLWGNPLGCASHGPPGSATAAPGAAPLPAGMCVSVGPSTVPGLRRQERPSLGLSRFTTATSLAQRGREREPVSEHREIGEERGHVHLPALPPVRWPLRSDTGQRLRWTRASGSLSPAVPRRKGRPTIPGRSEETATEGRRD